MLLMEPDSLCDANYANNAAVKTRDNDLLFLIFPGGNSGFTVYDGTDVQCRTEGGGIVITVSSSARRLQLQVLADAPAAVKRDGVTLPQLASAADFETAGTGWRADPQTRLILVKFQHGGGNTTLEFN
jgi:alpha-D-xyloside xylohydrolase